jgi:hypothetical protein
MARFIGTAGGFQKEKGINRRVNALLLLFFVISSFFFLLGYVTAKRNLAWSLVALALVVPAFKVLDKLLDKHFRLIKNEEDGGDGEREFVKYLKKLPDAYTVISDLDFADSFGNIDHLIIGPMGAFAIDVKNWRGTVSADGKGELLYNGQQTDKPQVRAFTRRVMDLKDRLKALTKLDPYVQCVFAFLRTRVDANWGTTGPVHCIRAEQIYDYVTNGRGGKPIPTAEISRLIDAADALRKLAQPGGNRSAERKKDA